MGSKTSFEMYSHTKTSETSLVRKTNVSTREVDLETEHEPLPPAWKDKVKDTIDRFWLLETISLFVSFGALAGIVGLLMAFDNKPLPQWSYAGTFHVRDFYSRDYSMSMTLNSILSLIATVYKIALGIPVAASLGQLKWNWFADGHKLADFQMFDSAKGVLGSLMLIWNMRFRRLACLAALVTLGSLALDFAFQSMVSYPVTRVPDPSGLVASLPVATYYSSYVSENLGGFNPGATGVDQSMLGSIYTGIFNYNGSSFVKPSCPAGDCAWNSSSANVTSYASLGVCGQCQDSTTSLQKSCDTWSAQTYSYDENNVVVNITSPYCNYTLPNGLSLAGNQPPMAYPLILTSGEISNTTRFQHMANTFSILSIIRAGWTNRYENGTEVDNAYDGDLAASYLSNATSTECALYHCVRWYNATVVNGTFNEFVLDTYQNDTADTNLPWESVGIVSTSDNLTLTIPNEWKLGPDAVRTYSVSPNGWQGAWQQFKKAWSGNVTATATSDINTHKDYSSDVIQTIYGLDDAGLRHTIDNLAHSMTNNIRETSNELGQGIAYQSIPYVTVVWAWICLPLSLLLIALILLASTIFRTKRDGTKLWKTSSLAPFYHPLTSTDREKVGSVQDNRHLEKVAEDIRVRWGKTEKGWRLLPVEGVEECRKVV